jgi:hypothetical protein
MDASPNSGGRITGEFERGDDGECYGESSEDDPNHHESWQLVRKRECISQKRNAIYGFPFQLEDSSLGDRPSAPWHKPCLTKELAAGSKASAAQNSNDE